METLDQVRLNAVYVIQSLSPSDDSPERRRQLMELGFIAGEQVKVMRRTQPGADPMVVRIGGSTFALRKAEARCIAVTPSAQA